MIFNGAEDIVHRDFEGGEVSFLSAGLGRGCRLVYCYNDPILILLQEKRLWFLFLPFIPSFGRAIGYVPRSILDMYELLSTREDVPHPGDFTLHQAFVGVGDLQPTDERRGKHVVIAVIHQGHLALKIIDVMFEALFGFHLDHEEVIVILLKLPSESILVIESLLHLFETPK